MKKVLFIIAVIVFLPISAFSQSAATLGVRLVSRDAGFEVTYPAGFPLPKREVTKDNMVMYTNENKRGACFVSYNFFEHSLYESKTVEQILDDAKGGYLKSNSKLISENNFQIGNYKGKSVKFMSKDSATTFYNRFDCIVYGDILIQVAFVGYDKKEVDKKDITDYFKSFSLIDKQLESIALKFAPDDDGYTVYLPHGFGKPIREASEIDSDYGKLPMLMYSVENNSGACILASNTYPDKLFEQKTADDILTDAMNGAINSQKFELISKQYLLRDGHPGLSYTVKTKSGNSYIYIRYEYCIKEPKLYQVAYSTLSLKELNSQAVLDYFKSFELNNEQDK
jgi:hypothetical protein